jgi:hypothetical protein
MRKENLITIEDAGEQKQFKVRQMSAAQGERFLFKLILLLGGKAEVESLNNPLALLGSLSDKPYERVQELLDDMLSCLSRVNGGVETQLTPDNVDGFIESPMTLLKLRAEAIKCNNFFQQGGATPLEGFSGETLIKRKA